MSCSGSITDWSPFFSTTCWGRTISALIGSALITVTAWLLEVAGVIFNWLVYYTVIQFGSFGSNSTLALATNIANGWSLFRDLSNIVMIGLFVFIAICTILGIKDYGYKKLVARVLIIAVLINFSLLFTKLIIDASNFTSYQFYNAAGLSGQASGSATPSTVTNNQQTGAVSTVLNFSQTGIAGQFLTYMGVTSIGQTYNTLSNGADSIQNGWIVLLHGLFSATMLLGAALVLLYGSFLLVTRAITIIILMLTASIAFATHLVPALDKRGWDLWWQSLINAAIFAPVLMIFLWMTIELAAAIKPSSSGSLGDLLSNPTNAADLGSLFGYLMILGMLYASFKVSSMFASMAGSFNVVSATAGFAAPGLSSIGAVLGRNTLGRFGMSMAHTRENEAKEASAAAARSLHLADVHAGTDAEKIHRSEAERQQRVAASKIASAARYDALANAKFGGKTSLHHQIDERATAGAKIAEKVALGKDATEKIRAEAAKGAQERREPDQAALKSAADSSKAALETAEKELATATSEFANAEKDLASKRSVGQGDHDALVAELSKQIAAKTAADPNDPAIGVLTERRAKQISDRDAQFQTENERIAKAREKITNLQPGVQKATAEYGDALKKLNEFQISTKKAAEKAGKDAVEGIAKSVGDTAGILARKQGGIWTRLSGAATGDNNTVAHEAKEKYMKSVKKNPKSILKDLQKSLGEDEEEKAEEKKTS